MLCSSVCFQSLWLQLTQMCEHCSGFVFGMWAAAEGGGADVSIKADAPTNKCVHGTCLVSFSHYGKGLVIQWVFLYTVMIEMNYSWIFQAKFAVSYLWNVRICSVLYFFLYHCKNWICLGFGLRTNETRDLTINHNLMFNNRSIIGSSWKWMKIQEISSIWF